MDGMDVATMTTERMKRNYGHDKEERKEKEEGTRGGRVWKIMNKKITEGKVRVDDDGY